MYFRIKMKLHTLWQLKERNCSITQTITKASQACLVVPHSWRDTMVDLYANYYGKSNRTKKICTKSSFDIEEFHLTLSFCYPTLNTYMAREHYMIHSQWRPRILELLTKHTTFYSQHLMCICTLGSIHTYDKHLALITWLTIRITTSPIFLLRAIWSDINNYISEKLHKKYLFIWLGCLVISSRSRVRIPLWTLFIFCL